MLTLYSDAGWAPGFTVAATLILEDEERQVAFFVKRYEDVKSSAASELLGVMQSLQWVSPRVLQLRLAKNP